MTIIVPTFLISLLVLLLNCRDSEAASFNDKGKGVFGLRPESGVNSKASFLSVDPSRILSTLINHGGMIIPKTIQNELKDASSLCHIDKAQLDILKRKLFFHNLTVQTPEQSTPSLRIGQVHVSWDSYIRPCVYLEVNDVDILLEFNNLILTRNNWHDLNKRNFPPQLTYHEITPSTVKKSNSTHSSFLRVGGVKLSGRIRAYIRSKPLNKDIYGPLNLDMSRISNELQSYIQKTSDRNLAETGRPGCYTHELYGIVEQCFGDSLRRVLKATVQNVKTAPLHEIKNAMRAQRAVAGASQAMVGYATEACRQKGMEIQGKLVNRLGQMNIEVESNESLGHLVRQLLEEKGRTYIDQAGGVVDKIRGRLDQLKRPNGSDFDSDK